MIYTLKNLSEIVTSCIYEYVDNIINIIEIFQLDSGLITQKMECVSPV